ncbi:hypothetical protein B0H11DRAFT_2242696 [Mycena galericulata]|nr:hypothetical protein B0H11DRAFT_2242696 [Mycena galericulata]
MSQTDNALAKGATASPATSRKDSATNRVAPSKATSKKNSDTDTTRRTRGDESDGLPELQCADDDSDDDDMPALEPHTLGEIAAAITEANYYKSLAAFRLAQQGDHFASMDFTLASALGHQAPIITYDLACQYRVGVTDGEGVETQSRDPKPRGNTNGAPFHSVTQAASESQESMPSLARSRM